MADQDHLTQNAQTPVEEKSATYAVTQDGVRIATSVTILPDGHVGLSVSKSQGNTMEYDHIGIAPDGTINGSESVSTRQPSLNHFSISETQYSYLATGRATNPAVTQEIAVDAVRFLKGGVSPEEAAEIARIIDDTQSQLPMSVHRSGGRERY